MSTQTQGERRQTVGKILLATMLVALGGAGCASTAKSAPAQPPGPSALVAIKAEAHSLVGNVAPLFVCPSDNRELRTVTVIGAQFVAIDETGKRIMPLIAEQAADSAGGADVLRKALVNERAGTMAAKEVASGFLGGLLVGSFFPPILVFTTPVYTAEGIVNGARLATSPKERLEAIMYDPESRPTYLAYDRNCGYIFFPKAKYCQLGTSLEVRDANSRTSRITVTQEWPAETADDRVGGQ